MTVSADKEEPAPKQERRRKKRKDGGAPIFAKVIERIREARPECSIETLIPDFKSSKEALKAHASKSFTSRLTRGSGSNG